METNANEYMSSGNYINATKAGTMKELQVPLIIVDVRPATTKEKKLEVVFGGVKDTLILNKTNLKIMIDAAGSDYKKWITKTISLSVIPSTFNGQMTKSVVISKVM